MFPIDVDDLSFCMTSLPVKAPYLYIFLADPREYCVCIVGVCLLGTPSCSPKRADLCRLTPLEKLSLPEILLLVKLFHKEPT